MMIIVIMENVGEILRGNEFKRDGATDEFNSSDDRGVYYFIRLRSRTGPAELTKLYNRVRDSLLASGLIRTVFTFVDSSQLLSRVNVCEARDRAFADRENEEQGDAGNPRQ